MKSSKALKSIASFTMVMAMVAPMVVTPGSAAAAPKLSKSSVSITTGGSAAVKLKGAKKGTWKSKNTKIATVDKKGNIKGVGAGNTTVTCKVKKKTLKVKVKVRQLVSSFKTDPESASIAIGEKKVISGVINNNSNGSKTNQKVTWKSSDSKTVKVKKKNATSATITGMNKGSADITATVASGADKKTFVCKVTVSGSSSSSAATTTTTKNDTKATAKPTDAPRKDNYPAGYVYKQRAKEVKRWYKEGTEGGYKHDGYSRNSFAIWMIGFFDNEYSTNQDGKGEPNEGIYGPDLTKHRGDTLSMGGTFWYDGPDQKTVLLQINYTQPDDYPMMIRWQEGSKGVVNKEAEGLKISKDEYGKDAVKSGKKETFKISSFVIPENAQNGDKDEKTGENYGIYVYFPNKPGGSLIYQKDNTFHFTDFWIKKGKS